MFAVGLVILLIGLFSMEAYPKIHGHRGSKGTHKENSLEAFHEAFICGAHGIELDLQMTADGEIVIQHDFKVQDRLIRDCKAAELDLVTLRQLCEKLGDWNYLVNLELKRNPREPSLSHDPKLVANKVMNIIEEYGLQETVYYSSFDPKILKVIKERDPTATIGLLYIDEDFEAAYSSGQIFEESASILSPEHTALTKEAVEELKKRGYQVATWTVNEPEDWQRMMEMGVDEIITDFPRACLSALSK